MMNPYVTKLSGWLIEALERRMPFACAAISVRGIGDCDCLIELELNWPDATIKHVKKEWRVQLGNKAAFSSKGAFVEAVNHTNHRMLQAWVEELAIEHGNEILRSKGIEPVAS